MLKSIVVWDPGTLVVRPCGKNLCSLSHLTDHFLWTLKVQRSPLSPLTLKERGWSPGSWAHDWLAQSLSPVPI